MRSRNTHALTVCAAAMILAALVLIPPADAEVRDFCVPNTTCEKFLRYSVLQVYNPDTEEYDDLYFCQKFDDHVIDGKIYVQPDAPNDARPDGIDQEADEGAANYGIWSWRNAEARDCIPPMYATTTPGDSIGTHEHPIIGIYWIDHSWPIEQAKGKIAAYWYDEYHPQDYSVDTGSFIAFNNDPVYHLSWSQYCSANHVALRDIMMHEMGHMLGLGDLVQSQCGNQSMTSGGTYVCVDTPQQYDISAIRKLWDCEIAVGGSFLASGQSNNVTMQWLDDRPDTNVTFVVSRADNCSGPYTVLDSIARGTHTTDNYHYVYTDASVTEGRPYWYRLQDFNGAWVDSGIPWGLSCGELTFTSQVSATRVDNGFGSPRVKLSWQGPVGAVYSVLRWSGPGARCPAYIATTNLNEFVDQSVGWGDEQHYLVRAHIPGSWGSSETAICMQGLVSSADSTVVACPGGDADGLTLWADLAPTCGALVSEQAANTYVIASLESGNATLWIDGRKVALPDTLWPTSVDLMSQRVEFDYRQISGCGTIKCNVFVGSEQIAKDVRFHIVSPDSNEASRGTVDDSDADSFIAWYGGSVSGCWDLDSSGGPSAGDQTTRYEHYPGRHHVDRKLVFPNGGE